MFSFNFLLLPPDYECQKTGSTQWLPCTQEEACQEGVTYRFNYNDDANQESFPNWYEQLDITCEKTGKVRMILVANIISSFLSQITAPFQVNVAGMRSLFILMTAL